jgi:hypothetical protein
MRRFISTLMMEIIKLKDVNPHEPLGTLGTTADEG